MSILYMDGVCAMWLTQELKQPSQCDRNTYQHFMGKNKQTESLPTAPLIYGKDSGIDISIKHGIHMITVAHPVYTHNRSIVIPVYFASSCYCAYRHGPKAAMIRLNSRDGSCAAASSSVTTWCFLTQLVQYRNTDIFFHPPRTYELSHRLRASTVSLHALTVLLEHKLLKVIVDFSYLIT